MLGGHVRAVFTLVTFIFLICVVVTLGSFKEIPLWKLEAQPPKPPNFLIDETDEQDNANIQSTGDENGTDKITKTASYGALSNDVLELPKSVILFSIIIIRLQKY